MHLFAQMLYWLHFSHRPWPGHIHPQTQQMLKCFTGCSLSIIGPLLVCISSLKCFTGCILASARAPDTYNHKCSYASLGCSLGAHSGAVYEIRVIETARAIICTLIRLRTQRVCVRKAYIRLHSRLCQDVVSTHKRVVGGRSW